MTRLFFLFIVSGEKYEALFICSRKYIEILAMSNKSQIKEKHAKTTYVISGETFTVWIHGNGDDM